MILVLDIPRIIAACDQAILATDHADDAAHKGSSANCRLVITATDGHAVTNGTCDAAHTGFSQDASAFDAQIKDRSILHISKEAHIIVSCGNSEVPNAVTASVKGAAELVG